MSEMKILEQSVRVSVLATLAVCGLCAAYYLVNWLDTGVGNWLELFNTVATVAGPIAVVILAVNLFVGWRELQKVR